MNSLYAESDKECLGVDFAPRIIVPPKKSDKSFYIYAKNNMTQTAKRFGVRVCLDYYNLSQKNRNNGNKLG